MKFPALFFIIAPIFFISCKSKITTDSENADEPTDVLTPVTITTGYNGQISDSITLNATSSYLLSTDVKANINGYINNVRLHLGDKINAGQTLFVLETKEAKSIGNTINQLDSSFKFSGISIVKSPTDGYVTMLNHQAGDYVQDGEVLASIINKNSFGFILNLPFEYHQLVQINQVINILLPDGTKTAGQVYKIMPQMDSISQTQQIFIKNNSGNLPAGLVAKVSLIKKTISGFTLPKECVYTDDAQQNFWVMKLLNDSVAVKIPVEKSIENADKVVIASPKFNVNDRFVMQGGYGLSDTAKISIQK